MTPAVCLLLLSPGASWRPSLEILQADPAGVGMRVSVQPLSGADFSSRARSGSTPGVDFWDVVHESQPKHVSRHSSVVKVPNVSNFVTPRYQQLSEQAVHTADDQALKATIHEVT